MSASARNVGRWRKKSTSLGGEGRNWALFQLPRTHSTEAPNAARQAWQGGAVRHTRASPSLPRAGAVRRRVGALWRGGAAVGCDSARTGPGGVPSPRGQAVPGLPGRWACGRVACGPRTWCPMPGGRRRASRWGRLPAPAPPGQRTGRAQTAGAPDTQQEQASAWHRGRTTRRRGVKHRSGCRRAVPGVHTGPCQNWAPLVHVPPATATPPGAA